MQYHHAIMINTCSSADVVLSRLCSDLHDMTGGSVNTFDFTSDLLTAFSLSGATQHREDS